MLQICWQICEVTFLASLGPDFMSITHRDVMIQLIREYQSLNDTSVDYRSSPTALEFSRIVRSNRPVVFTSTSFEFVDIDSISHWPALSRWEDPGYLGDVMGDQMITVAETPDGYDLAPILSKKFRRHS
jgi:hypothetical protein